MNLCQVTYHKTTLPDKHSNTIGVLGCVHQCVCTPALNTVNSECLVCRGVYIHARGGWSLILICHMVQYTPTQHVNTHLTNTYRLDWTHTTPMNNYKCTCAHTMSYNVIHSCTLYPPLLLLSQFWCYSSCLEGHRCLYLHGAWPGWKELLHSIKEQGKIKCWAQQIESKLVTYYLTSSLTSTSAPPSMSISLISTWPSLEAECSAVQPLVCYTQWTVIHDPHMQTRTNLVCSDVWISFPLH